ncbi:MAG: PAS domain S-box protein [Methanomicrobiales archaeon]
MAPAKKNEQHEDNAREVRETVEKQSSRDQGIFPGYDGRTPEQLIQELQVHQIELETQAEELRRVQQELEKSRYQYIDLYDFAPVGYLSLNEKTIVTRANLTAATLLGAGRKDLINHGFGLFIGQDCLETWDQYFLTLCRDAEKHVITLTIRRGDGTTFPARLEGSRFSPDSSSAIIRLVISDISDIVKVQEELREREALVQALMDSPVDSVLLLDMDGIIIDANETHARKHNLAVETMRGRNVYDLVPPDLAASRRGRIEEVTRTGTEARFQDRRADYWFDNSVYPIRDTTGNITRIAILARDITGLKRMEDELLTSHHRLESAMAAGNIAWWEMDCSTGKVLFSRRKAEMLGFPPEQFSHYSDFTRLLHPDDYEPTMQAMRDHLSGAKGKYDAEYRIRTSNGEYRWFHDIGGVSESDHSGTPLRATGLVVDVTERKHLDSVLEESEQRYRGLIDGVPDYILVHRNGTILFVNPAAANVLGNDAPAIVGTDISGYIAPESQPLVAEMILKRAAGETVPPYEITIIPREGVKRVTEVHGSLIMYDGRPVSLNVLSDITERKQAEQIQERLFNDIQQKNIELERFTYTVSHDLKSPLITIKGFLGYLEKDALAGDIARLHDDIARIHAATSKMEDFITSLLELSRVGRIVNPPVSVSLAFLVQEAVEALHAEIDQRGIRLIIPGDLPEVYGDKVRLQQVMTNLIGNAVKFMGDQEEPGIEISASHNGGEVIICVQDNGTGIAPENRDKIFSVFTRLNPAVPGAGIGLALVRRIVEVHGGTCRVESAGLGQGSTFCFSLPEKPQNDQ